MTNRIHLAAITISLILFVSWSGGTDLYQAVEEGDLATVKSILKKNPKLLNTPNSEQLTPLNLACLKGEAEVAQALLEMGADMNIGDPDDSRPIHCAAISGDTDTMDLLLEQGADINAKDNNGNAPLLHAAQRKKFPMVEYLVEQGAEVDTQNNWGMSALYYGARFNSKYCVSLLLDKGADIQIQNHELASPLHIAVACGHTKIVRMLVDYGADVNAREDDGEPPLCWARGANCVNSARVLVENGADVNVKDTDGQRPLHFACMGGAKRMVEFLLENGSEIDAQQDDGATALLTACSCRNWDAARCLIENGADVNAEDNYGWTAITNAAIANPEMVAFLLSHGARPNPSKADATTPLYMAIRHGSQETINLLLDHGAKINALDHTGASLLYNAVSYGKTETAETLLSRGARINVTGNKLGRNELHAAALNGRKQMVGPLLKAGVDAGAKDKTGHTPLDYAIRHGFPEIACALAKDKKIHNGLKEKSLLAKPVAEGEAVVWHLTNSGWVIKTQNHLLIFDYYEPEATIKPYRTSLACGYICADELKDHNVTVFSTHGHGDHYDTCYFDWKDTISSIDYVFGHQPEGCEHEYIYIGPREKKVVKGMKIDTIASTDAGVGFLVQVDGLTLFHAGDHADGQAETAEMYRGEFDYLAAMNLDLDIGFFPITGCGLGDPERVKEGAFYAIKTLKPRCAFPMHAGDATHRYQEFVQEAEKKNWPTRMEYALNRGDRFVYRCGERM